MPTGYLPAHPAQWRLNLSVLTYRCGGSAGIAENSAPASRFTFARTTRKAPDERRGTLRQGPPTVNDCFTVDKKQPRLPIGQTGAYRTGETSGRTLAWQKCDEY